jgi:hypothetical protein
MFFKILKYSVLFLAIYLWLQAYSPLIYQSSKLFPDDYRNGDLYHLSYLPQFKEKLEACPPVKQTLKNSNVNLFVIGDSFTEAQRVDKNDIHALKYTNVHWSKQATIQLDTNIRNVLIIETVERTFKDHFSQEVNQFTFEKNIEKVEDKKSWKRVFREKFNQTMAFIFPEKDGIEQRFESSLFSYDLFLTFREVKATLNQVFFARVEKKVVLSKDEESIFFSEEALQRDAHSAFYPFSAEEKNALVQNINAVQERYLKAGFDEVYLSLIPNKVSIVSPNLGSYNHLIEQIQTDTSLKMPFIDTFVEFKKDPSQYYLKSDSHWTCAGRDIWLSKVNKILANP